MAIEPKDFDYVYNNYRKIIDDTVFIPRDKRTKRQEDLFGQALLMEKLVYDSRYEDQFMRYRVRNSLMIACFKAIKVLKQLDRMLYND